MPANQECRGCGARGAKMQVHKACPIQFASVVASVTPIDGRAGGGKPKDWSPLETGIVRGPAVMEWTS